MGSQQQNFQHNGGPGGYPPLNQGYSAWDGQDHGGRRTWGCWEGEQSSYGQQAYGQQGYGHHYYGGQVPFMGWDRAGSAGVEGDYAQGGGWGRGLEAWRPPEASQAWPQQAPWQAAAANQDSGSGSKRDRE